LFFEPGECPLLAGHPHSRLTASDPIQTIKILASGPSTRQINGANIGAVQVVSLR